MQMRDDSPAVRSVALPARLRTFFDRESTLGYLLLAPGLAVLLIFVAYPFLLAIYLSLTNKLIAVESSGKFVGLQNYINLLQDSVFLETVINTFNYTFVSVFFKLVLGMAMALALNEAVLFKNLLRGTMLLPWIVPTALSALAWLWMFDSTFSVINWLLENAGLVDTGPVWLGSPFWAMLSVQIVNVWRGVPFFGITLLAGLQTIPEELYEAAEVDGARAWHKFWHITVPLLMPVTAVVTLFSIIQTFADFEIVFVLTRGGPGNSTHLFATLTQQIAIQNGRLGQGAAISLFMFPVLVVVVLLQLRYLRRGEN